MVVRRRPPLLLLLCLAALAVSVAADKKCRDRKTAKGCEKKKAKGFCAEEAVCPKKKKDGKKCKQTRKKCRLTCSLCTPGIDPVTNQPVNENYDPASNTLLTDMLTACGCAAEVDGRDMRPTAAAPYFCVKTEYKGANGDTPVKICTGGYGALNAATCDGGAVACGRSGYPSPPPSQSPSPPPTPTPPPSPPYVSPPSTPPTCTTSDTLIQDRTGLIAAMDLWCSNDHTTTATDNVAGNKKNGGAKCAPSTWHVKMSAGQNLNGLLAASACVAGEWGDNAGDDMNGWDVSEVTDMSTLFDGATVFNLPLNAWDVSKVTTMATMFNGAAAFNRDIAAWNVGKVTTMTGMFTGATVFDRGLNAWDVAKVTDISDMFKDAPAFNQPLNSWNTAKVTTMAGTFSETTPGTVTSKFQQSIESWNTAKVTTMANMFAGADVFKQNLNDWDVGAVTTTAGMFSSATAFNAPVNGWNVANNLDISSMFLNAAAFDQDISSWDVSKVVAGTDLKRHGAFFGTGLTDCNKKAVANAFAASAAALDDVTEDAGGANTASPKWSTLATC